MASAPGRVRRHAAGPGPEYPAIPGTRTRAHLGEDLGAADVRLDAVARARDHLSAFTITVVFAIFAVGTITTLLMEGRVAGRFGRRGAMLGGVATMMVAAWRSGRRTR